MRYLALLAALLPSVAMAQPAGPYGPSTLPGCIVNCTFGGVTRGTTLDLGGAHPATGDDWLDTLIPNTTSISQGAVLSTSGNIAVLGGTRTSDNPGAGSQGAQGLSGFAINDNASQVQTTYSTYLEARRYAGAGTTQTAEHNIINLGSVITPTPYSMVPTGETLGEWLTCGRSDVLSTTNCSAALGFHNNGKPFEKGLVIGSDALDTAVGGIATGGIAIEMADGQQIHWVASDGAAGASITSLVTSGATVAQGIEFTNTGLQYLNSAAVAMLTVGTLNTYVDGFTFTPAATGGVPIISATGTDSNIPIALRTKGSAQPFYFQNSAGATTLQVTPTSSGVNYIVVTGATTGNAPAVKASGSDTNVDLRLTPQGTGVVLAVGPLQFSGHEISTGTNPTLSACGGTPSVNTQATDAKGTITEGTTATGCVATFATAYATAPDCVVSSPSGSAFTSYSVSTTALTIVNASASGNKYSYVCVQ